jgi:hypothetical protein
MGNCAGRTAKPHIRLTATARFGPHSLDQVITSCHDRPTWPYRLVLDENIVNEFNITDDTALWLCLKVSLSNSNPHQPPSTPVLQTECTMYANHFKHIDQSFTP